MSKIKNDNDSISKRIDELKQKVDWFYGDDFNLDGAQEKYKEAIDLAKKIEDDLNNLKNEISIIEKSFDK